MTPIQATLDGFGFFSTHAGEFLFFPPPHERRSPRRKWSSRARSEPPQVTIVSFDVEQEAPTYVMRYGTSIQIELASKEFSRLLAHLKANGGPHQAVKLTLDIGNDNRLRELSINGSQFGPGAHC